MTNLPTIAQLKSNFLAYFQEEFGITINPEGQAFLEALATTLSGQEWLQYLAVGQVQNNVWPDTCDYPMLIRFGKDILARYPFAATQGQYTCTVTGTMGATVPGSSVFQSSNTSESPGQRYQIVGGAYVLPGTTGTITIQALTGGLVAALNIGDTLNGQSPILNVGAVITVTAVTVAPIDAETEALYRQNVLEKIQLTPGSWSSVDFRVVGTGVAGVQQVYAYAISGISGEAAVYLRGEVPGTPITGGVIADYQAALDLVVPIDFFSAVAQACPIDVIRVTITAGTFTPLTTGQRSAVDAALASFVNSVGPFQPASDPVSTRNDVVATYNLNTIISQAVPGYGFAGVTFTVNGTTEVFYQCGTAFIGNVPYLASVTYA